jgi:DNA-binding NarL/FixJ family response regulator
VEGEHLAPQIRVLVVDDHGQWRKLVRLLLQVRPEWRIISEASNGLEAVQKANEVRPDLILLDIGLPELNGIEAARRIQQISPESKMLFLSQESSADVVQEALRTGGMGYVVKAHAQADLLPAVEAVIHGERFISGSIQKHELIETPAANAPRRHEVQFYTDDPAFLDSFTRFIAAALSAGNPAIVNATEAHRDGLLQRLKAERIDVAGAIQQGTYVQLDADESLSAIMVNGLPNPARFFKRFSGLIETASKAAKSEHPRVAFCGEGVDLLWAEGKTDAAIRLEQLCNDLVKEYEIDILCAYRLSSSPSKEGEQGFQKICLEHSAVYSQ